MGAMHLAAATLLLLPGVRVSAEAELQGVGPEDVQAYRKNLAGGFTCLDGSGNIALSALNDDFCDCADGSDEPGTAACSGIDQGRAAQVFFYCQNTGSQPRYVYRSHVLDGVCDCCDGSDEVLPEGVAAVSSRSICPNVCKETVHPLVDAQQKKVDKWKRGVEMKKALAEAAEEQLDEWKLELARLTEEIEPLRQERKDLEKQLPASVESLKEEMKMHEWLQMKKIEREEGEEKLVEALRKSKHFAETTTTTMMPQSPEKKKLNDAYTWLLAAEDLVDLHRLQLQDFEGRTAKQLLDEHPALANLGGDCLRQATEEDFDSETTTVTWSICFFHQVTRWEKTKAKFAKEGGKIQYLGGPRMPSNEKCDAKKSTTCMVVRASAATNGSLIEQCRGVQRLIDCKWEFGCCSPEVAEQLDKDIASEVTDKCPYVMNSCEKTVMGSWAGWTFSGEKTPIAEFNGGDICKDDPKLNLAVQVKFVCGAKVRIKTIAEVSPCRYQASVIHPAACIAALAPKEPGPRLDKFKENANIKEDIEEAVENNLTKWKREIAAWESELVRLNTKIVPKLKEGYDMMLSEATMSGKIGISEYAKWMNKSAADPPSWFSTTTTTTTDPFSDQGDAHDATRQHIRETKERFKVVNKEFWDKKWRLKALELVLGDSFSQDHRRSLADLEGKCLAKQAGQYIFRVCFFSYAWRRHVDKPADEEELVGTFRKMDLSSRQPNAFFSKGDSCDDGKGVLEATVRIRCGTETYIESVEKKEECKFLIILRHPGGCSESGQPKITEPPKGPRMPRDEL